MAENIAHFRDRIKELRRVPARELAVNPKNYRRHPKIQQDAVRAVLEEIGYAGALLARQDPEGHLTLLDGHLRAELTPDETVPVLVLDVSEAEGDKLLLTFDPLSTLASLDQAALDTLRGNTTFERVELSHLVTSLGQPQKRQLKDPEPQIDKAEELQKKWGTERGQLWEIGSHRVLCGDNGSETDVDRLFKGKRATLCVTSPPYAVGKEYEDGVSFAEHLAMLRRFAANSLRVIVSGGFLFTNFGEIAPQSHAGPLTGSERQCIYLISKDYYQIFHEELRCDLYAQRIWYKPFNRLQQPFWSYHTSIPHHQEWEHIWTWRLPGGDKDQVYNWDISVHAVWDTRTESTDDKPLTRHSAAFPVCLPERAIQAHSAEGALIYDPFLGSGTTIVAAHQLNRIGYGIEIDPGYVAVTLERLSTLGLTPKLLK